MTPQKKLGQNFLKYPSHARDLVRAGGIEKDDVVVEVGPGRGIITYELLKIARKVIAVEKDQELISYMKKKFRGEIESERLVLVHNDILMFDPYDFNLETKTWKLLGALPYYITGKFLHYFLQNECQPSTLALIVQKEVAERIIARDGKESILSISVRAYGVPKYVKTVRAESFSPKPNVDSAILSIENISKNFFHGRDHAHENTDQNKPQSIEEEKFFTLVKKGFSNKRKLLVSNLKKETSGEHPGEYLRGILRACGISENARAENLSLQDWRKLYLAVNEMSR